MSLVNGGSGFPYFAPAVYSYLSGQDVCSIVATVDEVPNAELKDVLVKVHSMSPLLDIVTSNLFFQFRFLYI